MRVLLLLLMASSLLLSCANLPSGSASRPFAKPAECLNCGQAATAVGMCEAPYQICSGMCAGSDPNATGMCNHNCFMERSACIARAETEHCPAYCK